MAKIFVDSSFYLSILFSFDKNHSLAVLANNTLAGQELVTSHAVIGEILTVGSQRYNRELTIIFVDQIMNDAYVFLENPDTVELGLTFFKQIKNNDISWVDCYSLAIMKTYDIDTIATFDSDFKKLKKVYPDFKIV